MKIAITAFKGETPRLTDNLLESVEAQNAVNCDTGRGDLRAILETSAIETLAAGTALALDKYDGDFITETIDLDYIDCPIAGDQYDRKYFSGQSELRGYSSNLTYPAYYKVGLPAPTPALALSGYTGSGSTVRDYAYTYVTSHGEEGPPSDVSGVTDYASGNMELGDIASAPADYEIESIYVYRGNLDLGVSRFQFCLEATWFDTGTDYAVGDWVIYTGSVYKCTTTHPAGAWDAGHFTAGEDVTDANLGEVCPSEDWLEPPANLKGLICLDNGMCFGFFGNELFMTHAYLPHAWSSNSLSYSHEIISIKGYGTIVVIMTKGGPRLAYGDSPDTMQAMGGVTDVQPCVSKRSAASTKDGVVFASYEGLILSNSNGNINITEAYIKKEDWTALTPTGISGHVYNGKYYGFNPSADSSFVFDLSNGNFVRLSDTIYEAYVSPDDGNMYVIVEEVTSPTDDELVLRIKQWEGDQYNLKSFEWLSKRFTLGRQVNFAAARIQFDTEFYDALIANAEADDYYEDLNAAMIAAMSMGGGIGEDYIGQQAIGGDGLYSLTGASISPGILYEIYVDDQTEPKFTKTILNTKPFKLPKGYKCGKIEVKLSGNVPVFSVEIATSIKELM